MLENLRDIVAERKHDKDGSRPKWLGKIEQPIQILTAPRGPLVEAAGFGRRQPRGGRPSSGAAPQDRSHAGDSARRHRRCRRPGNPGPRCRSRRKADGSWRNAPFVFWARVLSGLLRRHSLTRSRSFLGRHRQRSGARDSRLARDRFSCVLRSGADCLADGRLRLEDLGRLIGGRGRSPGAIRHSGERRARAVPRLGGVFIWTSSKWARRPARSRTRLASRAAARSGGP